MDRPYKNTITRRSNSRSRNRSNSGSRNRSHSRSRNRSHSISRNRSNYRSNYRSRNRFTPRSRNRFTPRSRSRSRSRFTHRSRSRFTPRSRSRTRKSNINQTKHKTRRISIDKSKDRDQTFRITNQYKPIISNLNKPIVLEQLNVNNILFTQETISNSFTELRDKPTVINWFDHIQNNWAIFKKHNNNLSFDTKYLHSINVPEILYTLDIIKDNGQFYSCNNRRLCLLKKLFKIGFDGNINCKVISKCSHNVIKSNNVFIQKGNVRGEYCL
jgi:hypothetical protein